MKLTAQNLSRWSFYLNWTVLLGLMLVMVSLEMESGSKAVQVLSKFIGFVIWAPLIYQWVRGRNDSEDRALFLLQLADLLKLGATEADALTQLAKVWRKEFSCRFGEVSYLVRELESEVARGSSLEQAFRETKGVPSHWAVSLNMCHDRDTTIRVLAELGEAEKARVRLPLLSILRSQVLLVLLFGISIFLGEYILPTFVELFKGSGLDLPLGTKILVSLRSETLWTGFTFGVGLVVFVLYLAIPFLTVRRFVWRLASVAPFLSSLVRLVEQRRIFQLLSTATSLNVPLSGALRAAAEGASLPAYRRCFSRAARSGAASLGEVLAAEPRLFRAEWVWLVRQAEALENLSAALKTASELAAREHVDLNQRLATYLDTILLLVLGLLVGATVISAILPHYLILNVFLP